MSRNAIIVAGPNGSGKTTFATEYLHSSPDLVYISADAIAERLVSSPEMFNSVRIQAGRLFFEEINGLIQTGTDFIVEVTLAGKGFQKVISQLKQSGYTVTIIFIFLKSSDTCIARVRNRVRLGGHHVPTEDIIRRFYRSKHNFWHVYRYKVHQWYLFYNSQNLFHEVAFGENSQFTIVNETVFELFMDDL